jgi:hypothetical protein
MARFATLAAAFLGVTATCGCASDANISPPFAPGLSTESGPSSSLWGDTGGGPQGQNIGCIRGRRMAVVIKVHNRAKENVELLGASDPQNLRDLIERIAVQVRLAPPPSTGPVFVSGLRPWNGRNSPPVLIPAGRDSWVQSNFLIHNCARLRGNQTVTANRSTTLIYRVDGHRHTQRVSVPGAQLILTRGPAHPSLRVNESG